MAVADLDEVEFAFAGGHLLAKRLRGDRTAGDGPEHAGAGPGHAFEKAAAIDAVGVVIVKDALHISVY
jgi:hypothetical protein